MSDEQTPEEPATIEDLPRPFQEMAMRVFLAERRLQDAVRSEDVERRLAAADEANRATEAYMRAILDAGSFGDTSHLGFTPAEATNMLLFMRDQARSLVPLAIENWLAIAFMKPGDPEMDPHRERARAALMQRKLVTEHELETFPPASVAALVWDRYRAWDEAN
jgi:hypothetical protein